MLIWSIAYYSIVLSPLLAEALIYPGVIRNYLHIDAYFFLAISFIISILLRLRLDKKYYTVLGKTGFYLLGPIVTIIAIFLRIIELQNAPNFVYSNLHIDPIQTGLFGLSIYIVSLPFIDVTFFRKEYKKLIITFSFALYHLILTYWSHRGFFIFIQYEDGVVEYLTFFLFLCSGLISIYSSKYIRKLQIHTYFKTILYLLCIGFALIWFFIAGEEISWGQRILNIDTPEHLRELNTQEELNLHNNVLIFGYVYIGYLIANVYGMFSPFIFDFSQKKVKKNILIFLRLITSRWYLFLLFIPNFVYVVLRLMYGKEIIDQVEELSELFLSIAVLIVSYINLRYLQLLQYNQKR